MQNQWLNGISSNTHFNTEKLSEFGFNPVDMALLLSFPRSGNGWIRIIIAIFLASELDGYVDSADLRSISFRRLLDDLTFKTRALSLGGGNKLAVDTYVPDMYQYLRVREVLENRELSGLIPTVPRRIFKSHHLVSRPSDFHSVGLLFRNPEQCVISAAFLINNNLMKEAPGEIRELVQECIEAYTRFLQSFVELTEYRNTFLIPFSRPEKGLARWIKFAFEDIGLDMDIETIESRLTAITGQFPHKSNYKKFAKGQIDPASVQGYGRLIELYDLLVAKAEESEIL